LLHLALPVLNDETTTVAHVCEQVIVVAFKCLTRLVRARPYDDGGEPTQVSLRKVIRIYDRERNAKLLEHRCDIVPDSRDVRDVEPRWESDVDRVDADRRRSIDPLRVDVRILDRDISCQVRLPLRGSGRGNVCVPPGVFPSL